MTRDEMREMLARAIADDDDTYDPDELIDLVPGAVIDGASGEVEFWRLFASKADAVLAAIESTGHVIVPREPTEEMVEAAGGESFTYVSSTDMRAFYRALIDAYGQEGKS